MTMPISAAPNASQLYNVRLNQNFGDSPVGRLGNSRVQSGLAGAPRAGATAHAGAPSPRLSLGARVLNAVTPQGVRAESKVRGGLMATSALVGDLLGALSKSSGHSVDGLSAKHLLDSLPQTAAPLTRRGADLDAVFSQRTAVHVKNMSTVQLLALRDGVALAQSSALNSSHGPALETVNNAVGRELTQRLLNSATQKMAPILAKLVAELPREAANPGTVAFAFNELDGAAFTVLTAHGESTSASNGPNLAALKVELIKTILNTAADNGDISLAHLGAILGNLSSQVLHNLDKQTAVSNAFADDTFVMTRMVSGAIGLRAQNAEAAFTQAADALLARTLPVADDPNGSLHNPRGFAKDIIAAATNLTQRREHGEITHLHFSEEMGDKSAELLPHLERLCNPGNLLLEELSNTELHAFSKALTSLGVQRGSDHVAAELARRKDEASAGFETAMLATCAAAQSKDPHVLLQSLKAFTDASSNTVQTLQRLGAPIDGADKVMEFRATQSTRALETLSTEQLGSLFAALNSPELKSLKGSLGDMGQALLENENTAVGRQLYNASLDLQSLPSLVRDVLVSRGLSLPELPDEASYGIATLAPAGHAAILAEFGVEAGTAGTVNVKAAGEDTGPATPPAAAANVQPQPTAGAINLNAQAMRESLLEAIRAGVPGNELAATIGAARNEGRISGQEADVLLALIPGAQRATAPMTAGVTGSALPQAVASVGAPALSTVAMGSFGADTPVSRQNNTIWQQATKTGGLAPLANHVHVPIQGSGFCLLTALAASRGMTTPQLIEQLKTSATGNANQTATLARIVDEARNGGIDADQADVTALLASAGLAINIHVFADDGTHYLSPPPNPNAVDLMFRKGHFDLLMPAAGFDAATLTSLPNNYVLQGTIPANAASFAASSNA